MTTYMDYDCVITMEHRFPRNAEFWAQPRNLPIFTEFCRIR